MMSSSEIRLNTIYEQIQRITEFSERPPEFVLEAVSQLQSENIAESVTVSSHPSRLTWTKIRTPLPSSVQSTKQFTDKLKRIQRIICPDFFVAKTGDVLQVQVLLPAIANKSFKSMRHALYIRMHTSDPKNVTVTPVFRSSRVRRESLLTEDREITIREKYNANPFFPKLISWDNVEGSKKVDSGKVLCRKIIVIEPLYINYQQFKLKYPRYFTTLHRVEQMVDNLLCQLDRLHKDDLIHCDVKPNNILFQPPSDPDGIGRFMLTDFSSVISKGFNSDFFRTTFENCPPEFIQTGYRRDPRGFFSYKPTYDLWEIGVFATQCLTPPSTPAYRDTQDAFVKLLVEQTGNKKEDLYDKWLKEHSDYLNRVFTRHPDKEWLKILLRMNPEERLSAEQVRQLLPKNQSVSSAVDGIAKLSLN